MVFVKMARLCINIQKKIKKAKPFINLSFLEMRLKQLHFTGMIVMEMVYMMRMMSMNVMKLFARLRSGLAVQKDISVSIKMEMCRFCI